MTGYIYSISDSNTLDIIYIGSSLYPTERFNAHRLNIKKRETPFHQYLMDNNIPFYMEIIEEIEIENKRDLLKYEIYWIHQFIAWGFKLKNSVLYRNEKYITSEMPFPIRLGEFKPILQSEAFRLNISLHKLICNILKDYLIERNLLKAETTKLRS